ncbi:hypothetical protein TQ38_024305 [Novosphingobium sp. P6W]|nr:hypothetical protein TQ38_024305 [Novosphingobium sp. P6W]
MFHRREPFVPGGAPVRTLTADEIRSIIAVFGEAASARFKAGFEGVELHGAHGFLIQKYVSPKVNRQTDEWEGRLDHSMRFPLAVVAEAHRVEAGCVTPGPFSKSSCFHSCISTAGRTAPTARSCHNTCFTATGTSSASLAAKRLPSSIVPSNCCASGSTISPRPSPSGGSSMSA